MKIVMKKRHLYVTDAVFCILIEAKRINLSGVERNGVEPA